MADISNTNQRADLDMELDSKVKNSAATPHTGCPRKPYPLCNWVIMKCKIVRYPYKTIHFTVDVLRKKTSTPGET